MDNQRILGSVESYYTGKLREHGASPFGVDWNSVESQHVRFEQLLTARRGQTGFSINDYGCGYGALAEWLARREEDFRYRGFDISESMVDEARKRLGSDPRCAFVTDDTGLTAADYTVASGIFNVKLATEDQRWRRYVLETIERLWELSSSAMAFNMLTSYSDPDYMREDLYYADPREIFDHCKRRYSRHVALLHDYGLYEFTVVVRRQDADDDSRPTGDPGRVGA